MFEAIGALVREAFKTKKTKEREAQTSIALTHALLEAAKPIWKTIPGYPNYEANWSGDVRRIDSQLILKPYGKGKCTISLYRDGKREHVDRFVVSYETHYGPLKELS